jgi:hypothetical protein
MPDVAHRLGVSIRLRSPGYSGPEGNCAPELKSIAGERGPAHCWKKPYTAELRTRVPANIPAVRDL